MKDALLSKSKAFIIMAFNHWSYHCVINFKSIYFLGLLLTSCVFADSMPKYVTLQTNKGEITLELYAEKAPETVKNFVSYIKAGHYDNTIFHRVIDGFVAKAEGLPAALCKSQPRSLLPTKQPMD